MPYDEFGHAIDRRPKTEDEMSAKDKAVRIFDEICGIVLIGLFVLILLMGVVGVVWLMRDGLMADPFQQGLTITVIAMSVIALARLIMKSR